MDQWMLQCDCNGYNHGSARKWWCWISVYIWNHLDFPSTGFCTGWLFNNIHQGFWQSLCHILESRKAGQVYAEFRVWMWLFFHLRCCNWEFSHTVSLVSMMYVWFVGTHWSMRMDQNIWYHTRIDEHPLDPAILRASMVSRQADEWLTKFQQTPAAWQVSDQLLSSPETCHWISSPRISWDMEVFGKLMGWNGEWDIQYVG